MDGSVNSVKWTHQNNYLADTPHMTTEAVRLMSLGEFLNLAKQVYEPMPIEELATEHAMHVAKLALDAPAAERNGEPIYSNLGAKGAVMCRVLLTRPPFPTERGRLAWSCLSELLRTNLGRWTEDPTKTILRFEATARDPREALELVQWIEAHVQRLPTARRSGQGQITRLDGDAAGDAVVFHLAGPLASLSGRERARLSALNRGVHSGLSAANDAWSRPVTLSLEHPSVDLPVESQTASRPDLWQRISGEILDSADALILSDVGGKAAGFGAACELMVFARHEGPILYLESGECVSRSRLLAGLRQELNLDVESYNSFDAIPALVRGWVRRRARAIESAHRHRGDRELQYRPLQRRLEARWKDLSRKQRALALGMSGVSREVIDRMMTSIAYLATCPSHQLDALCRALNVPREDRAILEAPDPRQEINWEALLQLMEERALSAGDVIRLRNRAMGERSVAAYATRRRLASVGDWNAMLGHQQ
jgi:hypothetical protein